MKKLFCVLAALCMAGLMAVQAAAADKLPTGGVSPLPKAQAISLQPGEINLYTPKAPKEGDLSLFSLTPDWIEQRNNQLYNYIGTLEKGKSLQGVYNKLFTAFKSYSLDENPGIQTITNGGNTMKGLAVSLSEYPGLDINDVSGAYNALMQDNPQFFYLSKYVFYDSTNKVAVIILLNRYLSPAVRLEEIDKITETIEAYDSLVDVNKNNYTIEKIVHDKLVLDNNYCYDASGNPSDEDFAHNIAGSLSNYGGGVCESYAKAFKLLLNRYGVPCYFIAGTANGGGHAWNCVQLNDGNFYCVDVTWDDSPGYLGYTYFNMPVTQFYSNRVINPTGDFMAYSEALPACSDNKTYYTAKPNTTDGKKAPNGDYICIPPVVEEEGGTRVTTTEAATETTTAQVYSYETKVPAVKDKLQPIADNSLMGFYIESGTNVNYGTVNNLPAAYVKAEGKVMTIICPGPCTLTYSYIIPGNTLNVKLDDALYESFSWPAGTNSYSTSNICAKTPGMHKIEFELTEAVQERCFIFNVNGVDACDTNRDGKVTLADAIALLNPLEIEYKDIIWYDVNNDGAVNSVDAALALRQAAGI